MAAQLAPRTDRGSLSVPDASRTAGTPGMAFAEISPQDALKVRLQQFSTAASRTCFLMDLAPRRQQEKTRSKKEKKKKKLPIVGCRLHVLRKRLFRCRISQFYSSPSTAAPTWSCNQPQDGLQQPQNGGQTRAVPSPLLVVSCAGDEPRWCCTGN